MPIKPIPFTALVLATLSASAPHAEVNAEVTFLPTGAGTDILQYGSFKEELDGKSAYVAGKYGSFLHITASSGGSFCPGLHYIFDLSGPEPYVSDDFGGCAEALSLVSFDAGTLTLRAETAEGPKEFSYSGTRIVSERDAAFQSIGAGPGADPSRLRNLSLGQLFTALDWQETLSALVGADAFETMGFYVSGPSTAFRDDGGWVSSSGCARAMCSDRFAAMSIRPSDGTILVARFDGVSGKGFEAWGDASGPLPATIAEVVGKSTDMATLKRRFNALAPIDRLKLQERLSLMGFYVGTIDGAFGPKTAFAILGHALARPDSSSEIPDLTWQVGIDKALSSILQASVQLSEPPNAIVNAGKVKSSSEIAFNRLTISERKFIQKFARVEGYKGSLDGVWGPEMAAAMPSLIDYYNAESGTMVTLDDAEGLEWALRALQFY